MFDNTDRNSFALEDLLACARGELFGKGNAQLPMPPMLMLDKITSITETGGASNRGQITAELAIDPNAWFFGCHFVGDPVMPGCLGLDGLWQMLGFFLGWLGAPGKGRALGVGEIKFSEQILPSASKIVYEIDLKRVIRKGLTMGIGDGRLLLDGKLAFTASGLKVALFQADE